MATMNESLTTLNATLSFETHELTYQVGKTLIIHPHEIPQVLDLLQQPASPYMRPRRVALYDQSEHRFLDKCLRHSPMQIGHVDETQNLELKLVQPLKTGEGRSYQIWKVLVPSLSKEPLVARFYDPVFLGIHSTEQDVKRTQTEYLREINAFQKLASLQGDFLVKCFGGYSCKIGYGRGTHSVRLSLTEFVPGMSLGQVQNAFRAQKAGEFYSSQEDASTIYKSSPSQEIPVKIRQNIMRSALRIHALLEFWDLDIPEKLWIAGFEPIMPLADLAKFNLRLCHLSLARVKAFHALDCDFGNHRQGSKAPVLPISPIVFWMHSRPTPVDEQPRDEWDRRECRWTPEGVEEEMPKWRDWGLDFDWKKWLHATFGGSKEFAPISEKQMFKEYEHSMYYKLGYNDFWPGADIDFALSSFPSFSKEVLAHKRLRDWDWNDTPVRRHRWDEEEIPIRRRSPDITIRHRRDIGNVNTSDRPQLTDTKEVKNPVEDSNEWAVVENGKEEADTKQDEKP